MDGFPSGQRERTVNPLAQPTMVRIHPHPPEFAGMAELADAHGSGPCGVTPMQVQVLFPAPRRSKRLRACSDFFATTLAHARRCPSLQLTPRCRGFNLNFFGTTASSVSARSSPSKAWNTSFASMSDRLLQPVRHRRQGRGSFAHPHRQRGAARASASVRRIKSAITG